MRYKARLAWGIVLVLVMQLGLRSGTPALAVLPVSPVAAPPALGLSDLAVTAPDDPAPFFALPPSFAIAIPETTNQEQPVPIEGSPPPVQRGEDAGPRTLQDAGGSGGSGIHTYFVPFDDRHLWALFEGKASCHAARYRACAPLVSSVFVTAGADGTYYFYDHFEDGYDTDPLAAGSTTLSGTLGAGETITFSDTITPSLLGGSYHFKGGQDRITIKGEDANVVRLANASSFSIDGDCIGEPEASNTWLAAAWEVLEAADWGTEYHTVVGEDLQSSSNLANDHDYAGLEIMASQPDTEVYYGGVLTAVLGIGETHFVAGDKSGNGNGSVDSIDDITATAPIQVQMMTGACAGGDRYVSGHGYTLRPVDSWDRAYWAPVPGFERSEHCTEVTGSQDIDTDIYLHNPDLVNPIIVQVVSGAQTANVSIPANATVSILNATGWDDLAAGTQGTYMSSAGLFWGVVVIDSATSDASAAEDWDWGYSLIPEYELSSQVVIGYAPGRPEGTGLVNGNLAFVVAVTDTTVYVDLDQKGAADDFDMNGDGDSTDVNVWGVPAWDENVSDQGILVRAGQVLRVGDPNDYNLMGARIYTTELRKHIAAAWGQDPCRAGKDVYLDLGYSVLPLQVPRLIKTAGLAVDADGSGGISPGDTLTYTLFLRNNGMGTMNSVVLTDSLPHTYTDFVTGSLQITTPPPNDGAKYFDGVSWGGTPTSDAQAFLITWPTLEPMQTVTITFLALLHTLPPEPFCNQGVVSSANTDPVTATVCTDVQPSTDLEITKSDDPDPVGPGSPDRQLLYTLVYTNNGPSAAENVVVTDTLPPEVTFVDAVPSEDSGPDPLVWNVGRLAAGQSGTITVAVTVQSRVGETFTNTVHVATDTRESRVDNNSDQEPTDIATDLAIEKLDDPDPGVPGGPLTYTLVYTNNGPFDAQQVYITDTFPVSVTFTGDSSQPVGWSGPVQAEGPPVTLTWYTPTLSVGASGQIVYTVIAAPRVPSHITNTVCINTTTPDFNTKNNCNYEPTSVQMLYFRAKSLSGSVLLEWETAWEVDTYGFSLLRSANDRIEEAIEIAFVPAAGRGGSGATYGYRDRRLEIGPVYSYWLVEVDTSGRRTVYRSVTAAAFPGPPYRAYLPLVWRSF
jgi:uncharacterized repeat protein (TIGR01451 family)